MKIYVLRHAEAEPNEPDESRALTAKGEESVKDLARYLKKRQMPDVEEVLHSPLLRAKQTAEILTSKLKLNVSVAEEPLLKPDSDVAELSAKLAKENGDLLLVGHNPHLERLIALLVHGRADASIVDLKKCGLVCLERTKQLVESTQGEWCVIRWMLIPKLV